MYKRQDVSELNETEDEEAGCVDSPADGRNLEAVDDSDDSDEVEATEASGNGDGSGDLDTSDDSVD